MKVHRVLSALSAVCVVGAVTVACGHDSGIPESGVGDLQVGGHSLDLLVASVADLPPCNAARDGTVAYVTTPSSLYECTGSKWKSIPCTAANAGAVAYSSVSQTLVACSAKRWTLINIPSGKDSLVKTTDEPAGTNCPSGGIRVDVGLDANSNHVLGPSEISQTSYVCDGASAGSGGVCTPGSTQCNGNAAQTCDATGQWSVPVACPFVCLGGQCSGVCVPGSTQCNGNSVQTCDATGQWTALTACAQACLNGACAGVCVPGSTECIGNAVRTCSASGQWGAGIACPGVCSAGQCG